LFPFNRLDPGLKGLAKIEHEQSETGYLLVVQGFVIPKHNQYEGGYKLCRERDICFISFTSFRASTHYAL
jgi:hypothetical protein